MAVYGYVRVSTKKQDAERQKVNILKAYPDVKKIYEDEYTGRVINRPQYNALKKEVKEGDTIVFDEVSRMSRNAEEGTEAYFEFYSNGVNLVFLKEPYINTDTYATEEGKRIPLTGKDEDVIFEGINKYLQRLAKKQIEAAFSSAQREADYISRRTAEGLREAKANGKTIGRAEGKTVVTKKELEAIKCIKKNCKEFGGSNTDAEVIKICGVSRNSFYKYKAKAIEEANLNQYTIDGEGEAE